MYRKVASGILKCLFVHSPFFMFPTNGQIFRCHPRGKGVSYITRQGTCKYQAPDPHPLKLLKALSTLTPKSLLGPTKDAGHGTQPLLIGIDQIRKKVTKI